jgi:thioesterase domain-containing protein
MLVNINSPIDSDKYYIHPYIIDLVLYLIPILSCINSGNQNNNDYQTRIQLNTCIMNVGLYLEEARICWIYLRKSKGSREVYIQLLNQRDSIISLIGENTNNTILSKSQQSLDSIPLRRNKPDRTNIRNTIRTELDRLLCDQNFPVDAAISSLLDSIAVSQLKLTLGKLFSVNLGEIFSETFDTLCNTIEQSIENMHDNQIKPLTQELIAPDIVDSALEKLLICFQKGDENRIPIILVYAALGTMYGTQIVQYLPRDQPIYGTQAPDILTEIDFSSILERGMHHANVFIKYFPKGFHLVGWSFGGYLAYVISDIVQKDQVFCSLTLLDPPPAKLYPPKNKTLDGLSKKAFILDNSLRMYQTNLDLLRKVQNGIIKSEKSLFNELERKLGESIAICMFKKLKFQLKVDNELLSCPDIKLPIEITVFVLSQGLHYFSNSTGFSYKDQETQDGMYGWKTRGTDVKRISVIGNHLDFFRHEFNVSSLVSHLKKLIQTNQFLFRLPRDLEKFGLTLDQQKTLFEYIQNNLNL